MVNKSETAFRWIVVLFLTACAGCAQLNSDDSDVNMLANCSHKGAYTTAAGRVCVTSGNLYCGGSLLNGVCYGGYAVRAGLRGGGWVDSNTCEFDIREDTRITYKGEVIVVGPKAGNLSRYAPPLCQ